MLVVVDKSRGSELADVQRIWEIYDAWLQCSAQVDATNLAGALRERDVSSAWDIWSSAAETGLADAYRFAGGPVPDRG